jgi:hypothetical protein
MVGHMRSSQGEDELTVRRTMNIHTGMLALTVAATTGWSSAACADTAVATRWRLVGESQGDCMNHAAMAIWRSGFDKADPGSQSMTGKRGEYTAAIRCISEQRIVFFVMSGPSSDATAQYLAVLYGHF